MGRFTGSWGYHDYYFSADDDYFYFGMQADSPGTGDFSGSSNSWVVLIRDATQGTLSDALSGSWHGVNFGGLGDAWTFAVAMYGTGNVGYYPSSDPSYQEVGSWPHVLGQTSEIRIPRTHLGSLATGSGSVEVGVFATNGGTDYMWSAWPDVATMGGGMTATWGTYQIVDYPTVVEVCE